ncbi:MAG TPA: hypothetical protein VGD40_16870 [Chryseosolibacter sp.]
MVSSTTKNNLVDYNTGISAVHPGLERSAAEAQFKVFAMLWAIASLFHMAHSNVFDREFDFALLTLAALYVIFRPSMGGFLLLIAFQVFDAFFRMPFTTNHWIFTAFVNVTIFHALLYLVIRQRSFQISPGDLLKTFLPLVKIELVILYFFAVFHKINAGFFAEGSCAIDLLRAQNLDTLIPIPPGFYKLNAYLTLVIEALIPVLLCFRRTRTAGILVGLFFHCVLSYSSYNAFYDFSSMVFAVYFLFTAPELSVKILDHLRRIKTGIVRNVSPREFGYGKLVSRIALFVVGLGIVYLLTKKLDDFKSINLYFFWTVYSVLYFYIFISNQFFSKQTNNGQAVVSNRFTLAHWSLLIIPILVFVNGTIPYLGLKTENSYAMFSNLKTEGGESNHYIIPASAQIFDYQKDVIDIVSSSDPNLQKIANANLSMVWFEFKNYLHTHRPSQVQYLRNGKLETYVKSDPSTHPPKNNYVLAKAMKFRAFAKEGAQPCSH